MAQFEEGCAVQYLWKFLKWLPGGITILLMWCAQVGPKEAASHLAEWLSLVGIENIPPFLASKAADKWAFWIGLAGFLVWGAFLLNSKLMKSSLHEPSSEPPGYGYRVVTGIEKHEWTGDVATKTHTYQEVTRGAARPKETRDEFISMKEAATKLYTEARRCNSLMATGAEQLSGWAHGQPASGTVDDILDHVAGVIAGKNDVYAKRPPSTAVEKISKDSLKMYVFKEGATKLKHILPNTPSEWTGLAIRSADLDDLIAEVQFQSGFDEHTS